MTPVALRAALAELRMSQLGFARRWRVDPTNLRRWLSGRTPVPPWVDTAVAMERRLAELDPERGLAA